MKSTRITTTSGKRPTLRTDDTYTLAFPGMVESTPASLRATVCERSLQTGQDNGELWVFKSPFYTHAQFCSPCMPGAGNLDSPCPDGPRTYCLGHNWFDDGHAPYPVFSVETGKRVEPTA